MLKEPIYVKTFCFVLSCQNETSQSENPTGAPKTSYSFKVEKGGAYRNYTYYELDIYALGRRGSTWSSSKMIKN